MDTQRLKDLLSRPGTLWVAGAVVLFLAVYGFLGFSYYRHLSEQDTLRAKRDKQAEIAARSAAPQLLSQKEAEYQAIQEGVPSSNLTEIEVFRTMWDLAAQVGLDSTAVDQQHTGTVAQQNVGTTAFRVLSFSITVSGDFEPVWEFIQMLDRGETPYKTLVLGDTDFTLGATSNAKMDFKIYTRVSGQ